MADVVKALALVVDSASVWVRVPAEGEAKNENGHWDDPLHRRCPNDSKTGREWKTTS